MFLRRFFSFLIIWALIIGMVVFKLSQLTFVVVAVLGFLAQWEFYQMQKRKGLHVFTKLGIGAGGFYFILLYVQIFHADLDANQVSALEIILCIFIILGSLTSQIFEKKRATPVVSIALTLLGFFYVPYLFSFVERILFWSGKEMEGVYLVLYLVAVTKFTDVGAYVAGKTLGRHKMMPTISPKKTWEGFAGGLIVALMFSLGLIYLLPDSLSPLEGIHAWILGLLIPLTSVVGDLAESVIKRDAKSKDSGGMIPGIGGALDLIDSLLFTAPLFFSYLILFVKEV
ncbi:MAG: phosphatidate cytidylyltransferase [Verrucomicrobiota bacterium]